MTHITITQWPVETDADTQATAFSDLFFNHEHPAYDAFLTNDAEGNGTDAEAELLKDAEEFAACLKSATGFDMDTADLVRDFMSRL